MQIELNSANNLPADVTNYINLARANATNAIWWGQCENGWAHGPSNRPIAVALVIDEYYASYQDAMADGVNYGIKMCAGCIRHLRAKDCAPSILFRRPTVSLNKRIECGAAKQIEGEFVGSCRRTGTHYIVFQGKRVWKCANHIAPYLKAGFETFYIRQDGRVKRSTEELWDLLGL